MGAGDNFLYQKAMDRLSMYLEAEEAVLCNKSYTMLGKTFTRENLPEILKGLEYWRQKANEAGVDGTGANAKSKNIKVYRIIPKND